MFDPEDTSRHYATRTAGLWAVACNEASRLGAVGDKVHIGNKNCWTQEWDIDYCSTIDINNHGDVHLWPVEIWSPILVSNCTMFS